LRIAVLSDTHIPARTSALPGKVYEVCAEADLVLHSGDFTDTDVIRDLERFAPLKAVLGNMDCFELSKILPEKIVMNLEGFKVCIMHGRGAPMGLARRVYRQFRDENPDLIVFGHSHNFMHTTFGNTTMLNPGAVAGRSGHRSMAILTLEKDKEPVIEQILF
jgi:hypothetical protein